MKFDHDGKALRKNEYVEDLKNYGLGFSPKAKGKLGALMRPNEVTPYDVVGQAHHTVTPEKKVPVKMLAAGVRTNFGS